MTTRSAPNPAKEPGLPPRAAAISLAVLVAILFGGDMVNGVIDVAIIAGYDVAWPLPVSGTVLVPIGIALLLLHLARRDDRRRAEHPVAVACALAALALILATSRTTPDGGTGPDLVQALAVVVVTIAGTWLCVVVARTAGRSLNSHVDSLAVPASDRAARATAITAAALAAHLAAAFLMGMLTRLPGTTSQSQADAIGVAGPLDFAASALCAGIREEIVLVAIPVILMTAMRRPTWEIYAVALVIRVIPHLYLGIPAIGVVVFAGAGVWLYLRTGQITPIIVAHTIYNIVAAYGNVLHYRFLTGVVLVALVLFVDTLRTSSSVETRKAAGGPPRRGPHTIAREAARRRAAAGR